MTLQETYAFIDGNDILHSFLDLGTIFKCEKGFYNTAHILADKDNNKN
jgi:hypothetical protein